MKEFPHQDRNSMLTLNRLYDKIYPIAQEMGVELEFIETPYEKLPIFRPLVENNNSSANAAYEIIEDLKGRRSIGDALSEIDDEIMEEIIDTMTEIINRNL